MKIYLDYIFFENFLINLIIIYQIKLFTKQKSNKIRILLSVLILSIYTTLNYMVKSGSIVSFIIKVLVVNISIYIAFNPSKLKTYIKEIVYYFFNSFMLSGIIISLTLLLNLRLNNFWIKIILYITSSILLYIFNNFLWKIWKSNIKKNDLTYTLCINDIEIVAFVDTGNTIYDYLNNLDVIFIDECYFEEIKQKKLLLKKTDIKFSTVTGENNLDGYIVQNVIVKKGKGEITHFKNVVFVFVDKKLNNKNEYSAIISYDTYIEKLKGVCL